MTITSALRIFAAPTLLAALVSSTRAAEPHAMSWTVGGLEREALVYAPAKSPADGSPLLFVFHGHGGNMRAAARGMKYQVVWPEAIVVYPQGLPTVTRATPKASAPAGSIYRSTTKTATSSSWTRCSPRFR